MPSIMPTAQDCFRLLFKLNGLVDFSWLCLKKHCVARSWNCECTCMKVNLHNMKMADNLNVMIFTLYLSQISQCWTALSQGTEIKWVWLSTFLFTWSGKKSKHWRHKHWKVNIACTEFIFHSLKWGGASISYQVIRQVSHPHCHCHKEDHGMTSSHVTSCVSCYQTSVTVTRSIITDNVQCAHMTTGWLMGHPGSLEESGFTARSCHWPQP